MTHSKNWPSSVLRLPIRNESADAIRSSVTTSKLFDVVGDLYWLSLDSPLQMQDLFHCNRVALSPWRLATKVYVIHAIAAKPIRLVLLTKCLCSVASKILTSVKILENLPSHLIESVTAVEMSLAVKLAIKQPRLYNLINHYGSSSL